MTQDQSKPDQDVENTSSQGNSTATSTQDTQETPVEQQVNTET